MKVLTLDSRGRVSLGPLARFNIYVPLLEQDGTIVLIPVVAINEKQKEKV